MRWRRLLASAIDGGCMLVWVISLLLPGVRTVYDRLSGTRVVRVPAAGPVVLVDVGGWEHDCCGTAYLRGDEVEWSCVASADWGHTAVDYVETHHEEEPGAVAVRGRITDIALRRQDGGLDPLVRIPSGRALCGLDDRDDGRLVSARTGSAVERATSWFVVTVEL